MLINIYDALRLRLILNKLDLDALPANAVLFLFLNSSSLISIEHERIFQILR